MASLDARLRALELRAGGKEELTVFLVSFVGVEESRPVSHYSCGDAVVRRAAGESDESFRERALAEFKAQVPPQSWGGRVVFEG